MRDCRDGVSFSTALRASSRRSQAPAKSLSRHHLGLHSAHCRDNRETTLSDIRHVYSSADGKFVYSTVADNPTHSFQ
jgi:hypothetical protein